MSSVFSTGVVTKHSIASKYLRLTKEVDDAGNIPKNSLEPNKTRNLMARLKDYVLFGQRSRHYAAYCAHLAKTWKVGIEIQRRCPNILK